MAVRFAETPEDRYARQRLVEGWDQDRLAAARVVVVGAGALGNETLKLLALVGIGSIVVIDFDAVSVSNLSRTVLFREEDIGQPKAIVAAEATRELNPDVHVAAIVGDIGRDVGLGVLAGADIVLGGLDSINARYALNRRCSRAGVPWINAGISAHEGQVTRYVPDFGPCYKCTMTPSMLRRFNERYSCTNNLPLRKADRAMPTTAIGASVTAAHQVNDALSYLDDPASGLLPGRRLTILIRSHRLMVDELLRNPLCDIEGEEWLWTHGRSARADVRLEEAPHQLSPASLAALAQSRLPSACRVSLGFEVVEAFLCPTCGANEEICRPAGTLFHDAALCPHCDPKQERHVRKAETITETSPAWRMPLDQLGVASHDRLRVSTCSSEGALWVELGGPDPWVRPAA